MTVREHIINALTMFYTKMKGSVVNSTAGTSTTLPLSAAAGKDLQTQINTINSSLTNVGKIYVQNGNVTTSTNASTYTVGATITIPAGTYIAYAFGDFASTSDSEPRKTVQLYNSTDSTSLRTTSVASRLYSALQVTELLTVTKETKLQARVNANGTALASAATVKAIRIK